MNAYFSKARDDGGRIPVRAATGGTRSYGHNPVGQLWQVRLELGEGDLNLAEQGGGEGATDQQERFGGGGRALRAGSSQGVDLQRAAGERNLGQGYYSSAW